MSNALTITEETYQESDDVRPNASIALRRDSAPAADLQETLQIAEVFVKSGFFKDSVKVSQAAVKIMAGREYGFGPFASMNGIYIVKEKTALASNLMATAIKRSGKYTYRVVDHSEQGCTIDFLERVNGGWLKIGDSKFSREDAKKAGTQNMEKFPRNMLFARALSNGAKWHCPDAFGGAPVYVPEELGMVEREDGTYNEPDNPNAPHIAEPRRKSDAPLAKPDPKKAYRIAFVSDVVAGAFTLRTEDGFSLSAAPALAIAAKSALQSQAQVILGFAEDGVTVKSIEEME